MENFFKEPTLAALRELAMRQTAHEVEMRQAEGAAPSAFERSRADVRAGPGGGARAHPDPRHGLARHQRP